MAKSISRNTHPGYMEHTVKCPHCYGRGRVPKEGYGFTEGTDTYKDIYEEEQAVEEAERIICGSSQE